MYKSLADWLSGLSDDTYPISAMVSQNRLADWISGLSDDSDLIFSMPVYNNRQIEFLDYQMIDT